MFELFVETDQDGQMIDLGMHFQSCIGVQF